MKNLPSQHYLKECFDYDQNTGVVRWKKRPLTHFKNAHGMNTFNAKHAGNVCGARHIQGYKSICINNSHYLLHRIIWKLVTGDDPDTGIDHRDTSKTHNAFHNLRLASKKENAFNQKPGKRNKTGYKGVSIDQDRNKFYACIRANGKTISLGRYDTAEQAHEAYVSAARQFHGEFMRV